MSDWLEQWTASEFLERLADKLDASEPGNVRTCMENGCGTEIRRGLRCEKCRRARHAKNEAVRLARRKRIEESTKVTS